MRELSLVELDHEKAAFDAAVCATDGISHYCTGSDWAIAAAVALHGNSEPLILNDGDTWLALTVGQHASGAKLFHPLEAYWGFGSPMVGSNSGAAIQLLIDVLQERKDQWDTLLLTGLPRPLGFTVASVLAKDYYISMNEGLSSNVASLEPNLETVFSRRSSKFRANFRRDQRRAKNDGITLQLFDPKETPASIYKRIESVESKSWKAAAGESILSVPHYYAFYKILIERAHNRGALRGAFAQMDNEDIAYVVGGILGDTYRGYQIGYDNRFRSYGLGNLVQMHLIEALCSENISRYDLGMAMDYKARWSDEMLHSLTLVAARQA